MPILTRSKTLHDQLTELIEEHKEEPEPLRLEKTDVKKLLERSGAKRRASGAV